MDLLETIRDDTDTPSLAESEPVDLTKLPLAPAPQWRTVKRLEPRGKDAPLVHYIDADGQQGTEPLPPVCWAIVARGTQSAGKSATAEDSSLFALAPRDVDGEVAWLVGTSWVKGAGSNRRTYLAVLAPKAELTPLGVSRVSAKAITRVLFTARLPAADVTALVTSVPAPVKPATGAKREGEVALANTGASGEEQDRKRTRHRKKGVLPVNLRRCHSHGHAASHRRDQGKRGRSEGGFGVVAPGRVGRGQGRGIPAVCRVGTGTDRRGVTCAVAARRLGRGKGSRATTVCGRMGLLCICVNSERQRFLRYAWPLAGADSGSVACMDGVFRSNSVKSHQHNKTHGCRRPLWCRPLLPRGLGLLVPRIEAPLSGHLPRSAPDKCGKRIAAHHHRRLAHWLCAGVPPPRGHPVALVV